MTLAARAPVAGTCSITSTRAPRAFDPPPSRLPVAVDHRTRFFADPRKQSALTRPVPTYPTSPSALTVKAKRNVALRRAATTCKSAKSVVTCVAARSDDAVPGPVKRYVPDSLSLSIATRLPTLHVTKSLLSLG